MSTFLNFLSAAADFALTLNLKVAIVAAGFIVLLVLTRDRAAPKGKAPKSARHRGLPRPSLHHRRLVYSRGRTQPIKSDASAPVPKQAVQPTVQLGVKSVGL